MTTTCDGEICICDTHQDLHACHCTDNACGGDDEEDGSVHHFDRGYPLCEWCRYPIHPTTGCNCADAPTAAKEARAP